MKKFNYKLHKKIWNYCGNNLIPIDIFIDSLKNNSEFTEDEINEINNIKDFFYGIELACSSCNYNCIKCPFDINPHEECLNNLIEFYQQFIVLVNIQQNFMIDNEYYIDDKLNTKGEKFKKLLNRYKIIYRHLCKAIADFPLKNNKEENK